MPLSKDAPPSLVGLLKAYPWLGVLLALSLIVTLWAATRRAPPPPEPIPPAIEPAADAQAPEAEVEPEPTVWPDSPPPAPEPAASAVKPTADADEPLTQTEDGAWKGPTLAKPER
ncbi:MAG: hypothetical protein Q8T11_10780 [Elusimicrobiota bacterium]|nr:hypothetical protein [Elusimicrobiota bacterium]